MVTMDADGIPVVTPQRDRVELQASGIEEKVREYLRVGKVRILSVHELQQWQKEFIALVHGADDVLNDPPDGTSERSLAALRGARGFAMSNAANITTCLIGRTFAGVGSGYGVH